MGICLEGSKEITGSQNSWCSNTDSTEENRMT